MIIRSYRAISDVGVAGAIGALAHTNVIGLLQSEVSNAVVIYLICMKNCLPSSIKFH